MRHFSSLLSFDCKLNGPELSHEQLLLQASLFEASEREGADSIIKAQSPSQQGDAWRCSC